MAAASSPSSPDENSTLMPLRLASVRYWWKNLRMPAGIVFSAPSPRPQVQESVTIDARWWSMMLANAASRPPRQFLPPAKRMFAPGAMACTDSTSSVSSPYQPCGPHIPCSSYPPGVGVICVKCPLSDGSPFLPDQVLASERMVGAAYASVMATVTPWPLLPFWIACERPNADSYWSAS